MRIIVLQAGAKTTVSIEEGSCVKDALEKAHIDELPTGTKVTVNMEEADLDLELEDNDVVFVQRPASLG